MIITVIIGLWSTKLLLRALGATDYGTYNLVAGVIGMLSFLNVSMTTASQRYMSFYIGKNEELNIISVIKCSIRLHLIIGIILVIILEVLYFFLFDSFLNIKPESLYSAKIIYQFMIISTFATVNAIPFDAIINAHEDMSAFAIIDSLESILKFLIAFLLMYVFKGHFNLLISYGFLFGIVTINSTFIKRIYCKKKYKECAKVNQVPLNKSLLKSMLSFAGWNLYGIMCGISRNQGIAIVLNLFWGTIINASYGIANQVNGQISSLSISLMKAFNPQIMKNEGQNNRSKMLEMSMSSSKFSFMILSFVFIPLVININYILKLWLKDVPEYTAGFCILILLITLVLQLTQGIQSAMQAIGKIKVYLFVVGSINLLIPLCGYTIYKLGYLNVYYILYLTLFIEIIDCFIRIFFLSISSEIRVLTYTIKVIIPCITSAALTYFITMLVINFIEVDKSFIKLIISTLVSTICLATCLLTFITSFHEREVAKSVTKDIMNKIMQKSTR